MAEVEAPQKATVPARVLLFLCAMGVSGLVGVTPALAQDLREEASAAPRQEALASDNEEQEASSLATDAEQAVSSPAEEGSEASPTPPDQGADIDPEVDCLSAARGDDGSGKGAQDYLLDEQTDEERKKCLENAHAQPAQLGAKEHPLTPPAPVNEDRRQDAPTAIRWSSVGAFVGMVYRPSTSDSIRYKPGLAYGGYFRPELLSWLGVRLFYRKEFIPVVVESGGFQVMGTPNLDFRQSKLNVTSLGFRIEPAWVLHPRLRVLGVLGWSWLRFVAELPTAPGFKLRADRAGVEMNWQLGLGVSFDLVKNWAELSVASTYNFVASQGGNAYKPIQAVYEGEKVHLGPLPRFGNAMDVIFQLGIIL